MLGALGAEGLVPLCSVQAAPRPSKVAAASLHLRLRPMGLAGLTHAWQALPGPCSSPGNSTPASKCLLTPHVATRTMLVKVVSSLSDAAPHSWPTFSSGTNRYQEYSVFIYYASCLPPG